MKLLIDGRVLNHKKITGVENYANNIIKSISEELEIDVLIPKYKNKYYEHFWEHTILPIKALSYDLLFCPANIAPIFLPKSVKLVLTLHDLSFKDFPNMYSSLFRKYYSFLIPINVKRANYIISISEFSKKRIKKEYPFLKDKIDVVYHGLSDIFSCEQKQKKENYILYVGALNNTKNFSSVLRVFFDLNLDIKLKMISPKISNFQLSNEDKKLLKKAKNDLRIEIYDYMSQDKLIKYYQNAKLFIFPSFHESFGFPILEAMACGTPVVCSDTTALSEIGKDAVVYCNPYSLKDISNKIIYVLDDETLQNSMREKGIEVSKEFNWKKTSKMTIEVFKKVINR